MVLKNVLAVISTEQQYCFFRMVCRRLDIKYALSVCGQQIIFRGIIRLLPELRLDAKLHDGIWHILWNLDSFPKRKVSCHFCSSRYKPVSVRGRGYIDDSHLTWWLVRGSNLIYTVSKFSTDPTVKKSHLLP